MSTGQSEGWFQIRTRVDPSLHVTPRRQHSADDNDDGTGTYGLVQGADWQPGARVLAPWEPAFRYVGHIVDLNDDLALVEYEDGGSGWVNVRELRPFELRVDQAVMCRRERGPFYFAGKIVELRGNEVRVRYNDGDREWAGVAFLRFSCDAPGNGIQVVAPADWQGFYEQLVEGTRVWAPWNADTLFAGSVTKIKSDKVHIAFDDGDEGWVLLMQILPLAVPIGLRVFRPKTWSEDYVAGTITHVEGARVLVRDDEDFQSWAPLAKVAVPCAPIGPNARPTKVAFRWKAVYVLYLIGALIGLGILLLLMTSCD
jgi:hypothetical protein